jgi:hypothetical protein
MHRRDAQRAHFTPEDMSAFADARVAALKAGLKLTPDQEKNWPAFETAYRGLAKLRADRAAERMETWKKRREAREQNRQDQNATPERANPMERMQRRADAMSKNATAFKQLTDAAAPLYQSLDEAQKRRFTFLIRPARFAMGGQMGGHGRFDHHGPRGFERRGPRFGAAEGVETMEFAANAPATPDLSGMADDQAD